MDPHRKSICPFMKGDSNGSTEKATKGILHSDSNAFKNGMEVYGNGEKIRVLVILLPFVVCLLDLTIGQQRWVGEDGIRDDDRVRLVFIGLVFVTMSAWAMAVL